VLPWCRSLGHDKEDKGKQMPVCVIHYTQYMGGVDNKDQMLQRYLVARNRMNKWYIKLFRRPIQCQSTQFPHHIWKKFGSES
jgi:hypothetical protein